MTAATNPFPHIAVPAGATAGEWEHNLQYDGCSRALTWREYGSPTGVAVEIDGRQESDGAFSRQVSIWGLKEGEGMSSADARKLAALLVAAADGMDKM